MSEAPVTAPCWPKWILMNLPKRDELLLRCVFALPNASVIGFAWRITVEIASSSEAREARCVR